MIRRISALLAFGVMWLFSTILFAPMTASRQNSLMTSGVVSLSTMSGS
jgi:hypothetical protein